MTEDDVIRMTERELALFRAGEAIGKAKGIEEAADLADRAAKDIAEHVEAVGLLNAAQAMTAALRGSAGPRTKRMATRFGESMTRVAFVAHAAPNVHAQLVGIARESARTMRARATENRTKFTLELARAARLAEPAGATIVQRVARRILRKIS